MERYRTEYWFRYVIFSYRDQGPYGWIRFKASTPDHNADVVFIHEENIKKYPTPVNIGRTTIGIVPKRTCYWESLGRAIGGPIQDYGSLDPDQEKNGFHSSRRNEEIHTSEFVFY